MALIRFLAMPTEDARALQRGGSDAYGNPPERKLSDGSGVPCRHCLRHVAAGEDYLVLAYRPFPALQPYGVGVASSASLSADRTSLEAPSWP